MKHSTAISFKIPASLAAIDELCVRARSWLQEHGLENDWFAIAMLLRESLNNAVIHGGRENPAELIHCELRRGGEWLSILVEDGGHGFDWVHQRKQRAGHEGANGRGLEIYQLYADAVVFNRPGNRVVLRRRLRKGKQDVISSD
jgi:anti-sigma regulatory factor (Ser/Thr protein kinase)